MPIALDEYIAARREQVEAEAGAAPSAERTSEEGKKLADTPMLTGDPEFDALELQETSVERKFE